MTDFLKMDVFFVVTTIVVVLIGALVIVALLQVVRFLRTVNRIGEQVEEETAALREDIGEARARIKQEGFRVASLVSLATKAGKRMTKNAKRAKRTTSTNE